MSFFYLAAFLLITFFVYFTITYFFFRLPWELRWLKQFHDFKLNIVNKMSPNRLIFGGGSNVLFGLSAKKLSGILNRETSNFGIASGVQPDYLSYYFKKVVKPGDTLVLALEYSFLLFDGEHSYIKKNYVRTYDRSFFYKMPWLTQLKLTLESNMYFRFKDFIRSIKCKNVKPKINYDVNALNEYGDQHLHDGNSIFLKKFNSGYYRPVDIQKNKPFKETQGLKLLSEFSAWCSKNGVHLIVSYAATVDFEDYQTEPYRSYFEFIENYYKEKNIETLGNPYDFFYTPESFYDARYHLNLDASLQHTDKLGKMLLGKI